MRDAAAAFLDFVFCFLILFSNENVLANLENARRRSPVRCHSPAVPVRRRGKRGMAERGEQKVTRGRIRG